MKKLDNTITKLGFIHDIDVSLKQEYIKSLKDEYFKSVIMKIPLTEEVLMKHTTKLQECASDFKNCKNCSGIVECKNDVVGFAIIPELIGKTINFAYIPCRYKQKLTEKNRYQKNVYYFDMPKEIKEAKMKDIYTSDKNRVDIIGWLTEFIDNYDKDKHRKGIYLCGNFGGGKTYLIAAMFNELAKRGNKVAIIYWPEFLRDLKASFDDDFGGKYNYIKQIPVLLIDDIGAENSTPWGRDEILGPLLQYRMQERLSTFFTSNLNLEELEIHFSDSKYKTEQVKAKRIIERIKYLSEEKKMVSKNNRK
jgi:primosomal protein DnaI